MDRLRTLKLTRYTLIKLSMGQSTLITIFLKTVSSSTWAHSQLEHGWDWTSGKNHNWLVFWMDENAVIIWAVNFISRAFLLAVNAWTLWWVLSQITRTVVFGLTWMEILSLGLCEISFWSEMSLLQTFLPVVVQEFLTDIFRTGVKVK